MHHYVYRITNILSNKHYYGSRTSTVKPIDDMFKHYFSSSKYVQEDIKLYGLEHFRYKILRVFSSRNDAYRFEEKIQRKLEVAKRDNWYNKSYAAKNFYGPMTDDIKQKISKTKRGKKMPDNYVPWNKNKTYNELGIDTKKFGSPGVKNSFYGKTHSKKVRKIISEKNIEYNRNHPNAFLGKKHSEETKQKLSELAKRRTGEKASHYGKKHSEETKQKMRDNHWSKKGRAPWNKGLKNETAKNKVSN